MIVQLNSGSASHSCPLDEMGTRERRWKLQEPESDIRQIQETVLVPENKTEEMPMDSKEVRW